MARRVCTVNKPKIIHMYGLVLLKGRFPRVIDTLASGQLPSCVRLKLGLPQFGSRWTAPFSCSFLIELFLFFYFSSQKKLRYALFFLCFLFMPLGGEAICFACSLLFFEELISCRTGKFFPKSARRCLVAHRGSSEAVRQVSAVPADLLALSLFMNGGKVAGYANFICSDF